MNPINYQTIPLDKAEFPQLGDFGEFIDIWKSKKSDAILPSWSDLGFTAFPNKMIPFLSLTDVTFNPLRFRYRFIGTAITNIEGKDYTGSYFDEITPSSYAQSIIESNEPVVSSKAPVIYRATIIQGNDKIDIASGIRLPLSNDGSRIDNVLALIKSNTSLYQINKIFAELENN